MPLYEYECDACGHRFEIIRKFSDPPVDRCPKCGGQVHKLQSAPAFHLKGSGWYITDYGRKDSGSTGADSKGDSASGETKSDTTKTTESKPESKTEKTDKTDEERQDERQDAARRPRITKPDTKPTS